MYACAHGAQTRTHLDGACRELVEEVRVVPMLCEQRAYGVQRLVGITEMASCAQKGRVRAHAHAVSAHIMRTVRFHVGGLF
jgi:hypothetical protein